MLTYRLSLGVLSFLVFVSTCLANGPTVELPIDPSLENMCQVECVRSHPDWVDGDCGQWTEHMIRGDQCYEVHSECFQTCQNEVARSQTQFLVPATQVRNLWRQGQVCDSGQTQFPLDLLPGDEPIDPSWSGACECLNGDWHLAECGHQEVSCDQVCDQHYQF